MAPLEPTDYDKQQDQQGQAQGLEIQNLQNKLTGVETDVVQQGTPATTLQRLRINVPSPSTHFLLGQRVTGTTPFGYTGASVQTEGNLFIDIKEDTVVQTKGFSLMQTDSDWQQYSNSSMELSSFGGLKVAGGSVFIAALPEVNKPSFKDNNGQKLKLNPTNNLDEALKHTKSISTKWDYSLTALGLIMTGVFYTPLNRADLNSWLKTLDTGFSTGLKVWNTGEKILSAKHTRTVTIYGQEGVTVMSPEKLSFTTERSMKLFAQTGVSLTSGLSSSIMAVQGVKCFGGLKASLEGGFYADVKAGKALGVACLRGKLSLKGNAIEIGTDAPKLAQAETKSVWLVATETIMIGAAKKTVKEAPPEKKPGKMERMAKWVYPKPKSNEVTVTPNLRLVAKEKISIDSEGLLHGVAQKAVKIQVGTFAIEIKPEGIKIGKGSDGNPENPMIAIGKDSIVLEVHGMEVKLGKQEAAMGHAGNKLAVDRQGGIWLKGKRVKIG